MNLRYFNKGFNYSQDGNGNRMVIHLQGCNLHCPWCSNPEGIDTIGKSKEISLDKLFEEITSSKRLFFDGGGVTFTGGECMLQSKPLEELLIKLKNDNINTAIETNSSIKIPKSMLINLDNVICDFKHYDEIKLAETVGIGKEYKNNVIYLINNHKNVRIRILLINGFNSSHLDAEKFAEFFIPLNTKNTKFEFLSYHEYGKVKWENLNMEYTVKNGFISEKTKDYFEKTFNKYNLKTIRS